MLGESVETEKRNKGFGTRTEKAGFPPLVSASYATHGLERTLLFMFHWVSKDGSEESIVGLRSLVIGLEQH